MNRSQMNNVHAVSVEDEGQFWETVKDDVLFSIKETLADYEECRIGLAGGSTPKRLYEILAEEDLPWEKIKLILIDERYVPSDNKNSNLRMIRESLLKKITIPATNIISFDTSLPQESAAKEMHRKVAALKMERSPIFDLLILGAGADGHIASLFEGDSANDSTEFASTANAKNYDEVQRLTLTLPALKSAVRAILLLKGEGKATVFADLENMSTAPGKLTALKQILQEIPTKILWCKN